MVLVVEAEETRTIIGQQLQTPRQRRRRIDVNENLEDPIAQAMAAGREAFMHDLTHIEAIGDH
jgi:hypothetical protein